MIEDDKEIAEFRAIASNLYLASIESNYGEDSISVAENLTDCLTRIFSYLDLRRFEKIVVSKNLDGNDLGEYSIIYSSEEEFSQIEANIIYIEILQDGRFGIRFEIPKDLGTISQKAIVYLKEKGANEYFIVKEKLDRLSPLSNLETYFIKPTFKELDTALSKYKTDQAYTSSCLILREKLWEDDKRIIMIAAPEHVLRDSLYQFLRARLRGNKEVLREQNVSATRPIDIRVTWNYTSHVALIEIKWIGLTASGNGYENKRAITQANKGAKQLSDYLELFKTESPNKTTRGYLVVFDSRRNNIDVSTTSLNQEDALFFEFDELVYDPKYELERADFEPPVRFFLRPKL